MTRLCFSETCRRKGRRPGTHFHCNGGRATTEQELSLERSGFTAYPFRPGKTARDDAPRPPVKRTQAVGLAAPHNLPG